MRPEIELGKESSFRWGGELVEHDGKSKPWGQVTWIPNLLLPNKLGDLGKNSLSLSFPLSKMHPPLL